MILLMLGALTIIIQIIRYGRKQITAPKTRYSGVAIGPRASGSGAFVVEASLSSIAGRG